MIKSLEELYEIIKTLRSDNGCPWDKVQTLQSLDKLFLEECFELSDAIQENNKKDIQEELGDVSFMLLLMSYIAEQDNICNLSEVYNQAKEKLIFRHPHVFGNSSLDTENDIQIQWELLKKQEKSDRKSTFDGIPKSLPEMMRFDKIIRKLKNHHSPLQEYKEDQQTPKAMLKNTLIDLASQDHDLTQMIKEINLEIEQEARKKGL